MDEILKTLLAEGAGEGEEGMYAIASAILNRAKRRGLTPEQVVNQPKQFSGRWRPDLDAFIAQQPPEAVESAKRAWARASASPMPGVDHYLTEDLYRSGKAPSWARRMGAGQVIGRHRFFDSTQGGGGMPRRDKRSDAPMKRGEQMAEHINRLVLASGMGHLKAREIVPILAQDAPRPMDGYKNPSETSSADAGPRHAFAQSGARVPSFLSPPQMPGALSGAGAAPMYGMMDSRSEDDRPTLQALRSLIAGTT